MAYVQITPPLGDLNHQPPVPFNGNYETIQGCFRLIDAALRELYAAGFAGATAGTLISNTPGAGTITGFAPTGLTSLVDRLDVVSDASDTTLNDMTAGYDGQKLRVRNTGSGTLTLTSENSGSTASTRFLGANDVAILAGDKVDLIYYAGSINRWTM